MMMTGYFHSGFTPLSDMPWVYANQSEKNIVVQANNTLLFLIPCSSVKNRFHCGVHNQLYVMMLQK